MAWGTDIGAHNTRLLSAISRSYKGCLCVADPHQDVDTEQLIDECY